MMYIVEHYTGLTRSNATHINKYSLQRERKKTKRKKNIKCPKSKFIQKEKRRTLTERRNTKKFRMQSGHF